MRNLAKILAPVALLASTTLAASGEPKSLLVVAFDISDSAPVAINEALANDAASRIQWLVANLEPGDEVKLRSLGMAGLAVTQISIDIALGRKPRTRPDKIAPVVGNLIRSFPARVQRGELKIQNQTNIIGFLEALSPSLDCERQPTHIVIFSDGIEWSTQVRGNDLVSGKADLPPPSGPILQGCDVEMRGVGQQTAALGTDSRWFPRLRSQWTQFFEAAGVSRFGAYAEFK